MKVEYVNSMGTDLDVVSAARTKTHIKIVKAATQGYRIEEGKLYGKSGIPLSVKLSGKQRYPTFTVNFDKEVFGIPVHIFAAYLYYGEQSFKKGIVVRHLNGNTEDYSKNNIVLGSHSENNLDKPITVRIAAAKKARSAQEKRPHNAKLTDEQVQIVVAYYANLAGKKAQNGTTSALAKKLGVTKTTLSLIKRGKYYAS